MDTQENRNNEESFFPKGAIFFFMMLIGFISILWFLFYMILMYRN